MIKKIFSEVYGKVYAFLFILFFSLWIIDKIHSLKTYLGFSFGRMVYIFIPLFLLFHYLENKEDLGKEVIGRFFYVYVISIVFSIIIFVDSFFDCC